MRRITSTNDNERGAVAIIVGLLMVALLGFAALAVDVGAMYVERAQLQNGADAAALSVAKTCGNDELDAACINGSPLAAPLTNANANDGNSNVISTTVDTAANTATVVAGASQAGQAPNSISLFFAQVLDPAFSSTEISATATASWQPPASGPVGFPMTFSSCEFDSATPNMVIEYQGTETCAATGPSGLEIPGGFGWLLPDAGTCAANVTVGEFATGDPGTSIPGGGGGACTALLDQWKQDLQNGLTVTVYLPIFNDVSGTGSGGAFLIEKFAAFEITGWNFPAGGKYPEGANKVSCPGPGDCKAIRGTFVEYVSSIPGYSGVGPDAGAYVVRLTD